MKNQKSYITHQEIDKLKTIEEVNYWIKKYNNYNDKEERHINWRAETMKLLKKRKEEIANNKKELRHTHTHTHTQQKRCRFCEKDHYGSQRACRNCIERHRPKLSLFWIFFWLIFSAGIISIIYYLWKKNQQEEWNRINL